ncbi:hypothetical protein DFH08DRAFT_801430 [Mycena albidolilacea]|uniref:Uncharacterized protein n=1 Tax=Mycena albidolilacea TaxID=1033008 RepID=A0AAD7EZC5_9AGAR|nr:hypothetical protein DFH08DRAFT_801430 [Mycena albidolilacea]
MPSSSGALLLVAGNNRRRRRAGNMLKVGEVWMMSADTHLSQMMRRQRALTESRPRKIQIVPEVLLGPLVEKPEENISPLVVENNGRHELTEEEVLLFCVARDCRRLQKEEAACSVEGNRSCRKTRIDLEETGLRLTYKPEAVEAAAERSSEARYWALSEDFEIPARVAFSDILWVFTPSRDPTPAKVLARVLLEEWTLVTKDMEPFSLFTVAFFLGLQRPGNSGPYMFRGVFEPQPLASKFLTVGVLSVAQDFCLDDVAD